MLFYQVPAKCRLRGPAPAPAALVPAPAPHLPPPSDPADPAAKREAFIGPAPPPGPTAPPALPAPPAPPANAGPKADAALLGSGPPGSGFAGSGLLGSAFGAALGLAGLRRAIAAVGLPASAGGAAFVPALPGTAREAGAEFEGPVGAAALQVASTLVARLLASGRALVGRGQSDGNGRRRGADGSAGLLPLPPAGKRRRCEEAQSEVAGNLARLLQSPVA